MLIEHAQVGDMPAVLALVEELLVELGDEGREFAGIREDRLQADLAINLASGRFLALVAKDASGTAVGVLTLSVSFAVYAGGEYGIIDEMYVCPRHRGRGVGRALMEEAARVARARGWFRLDVTGPTDDREHRVSHFYEGLGFEPTGTKFRLLI